MRQQSFFKAQGKAHGGLYSVNKRRSKRVLNTKQPLHVTLRSEFAKNRRSLLKHKKHINFVIQKAARLFNIRVFELAICGNHLHLLIQGNKRPQIQNFFRVVAGHIAQEILRQFPLSLAELAEQGKRGGGASGSSIRVDKDTANTDRNTENPEKKPGCKKNQRKFWQLLIYSRIVTWGKEFKTVARYIVQNTLEALNIIAYKPRKIANQQRKTRYNSS